MIENLTSPISPTFMSTELIEPSPLDPLCICFLHPNDAEKIIKKYPDFDQAVVVTEFIQEGTSIVIPKNEAINWFMKYDYSNLAPDEDGGEQAIKALLKKIEGETE